jgi:hypothetical protein
MSSHHQNHVVPAGRVDGPGLLYGGVGLALALAMQMLGLFMRGDGRLKQALLEPVFRGQLPDVLTTPALVIIAAVLCWGLAFAVLDSAGTWRRIVLGVTMVVIVLAMVPTFAVWNVYFSPFLPLVGVFWTWFCTMMYVNHHAMPCDGLSFKNEVLNTKIETTAHPVAEKKEHDPDAKYQPQKSKEKTK